ncbi:hypothetical protein OG21DRAFT_1518593 [Imleria badia]|nr:hypothetical protein OG21DRAFT_1518593 [Imleria badia]
MNFGVPITNDYLRKLKPYAGMSDAELTAKDRSKVALDQKDTFAHLAIERLEQLKKDYGLGVTTLCRIYNASGDQLTVNFNYSWRGYFHKDSPALTIENGQWTVFIHVQTKYIPRGSAGAVVYRTAERDDIFLGWQTPFHPSYYPACVAEVKEKNSQWWDSDSQERMLQRLYYGAADRCNVEGKGYKIDIQIGNSTTSFCVATIQKA